MKVGDLVSWKGIYWRDATLGIVVDIKRHHATVSWFSEIPYTSDATEADRLEVISESG
tara:strand:+ start:11397 stop:11570 length:174 start_codon:yes stop_codon:yes gene_type:complete